MSGQVQSEMSSVVEKPDLSQYVARVPTAEQYEVWKQLVHDNFAPTLPNEVGWLAHGIRTYRLAMARTIWGMEEEASCSEWAMHHLVSLPMSAV